VLAAGSIATIPVEGPRRGPSEILPGPMKRILLVDDDPRLLASLLRHLRAFRDEWDVSTAANGQEAVDLVSEQDFDLVVTDMLMPEKEGVQTILELRRLRPELKLVAMSGGGRFVGKDVLNTARALGAHATLEKPFDVSVLIGTLRNLLGEPGAGA